uniref:Apple domain-containing protein n=1 Tax=Fagus sylvatica TaxID=28930 RepID=A0A2N9FAP6_FAGSY
MAPGSRGIGAVFVHLSGEDSDQMGDAFGEPRVPRRSWSRYLSNAPGLVDQLVASRKDSAREGGCPGGKTQATGVFLVRLRAVFRSGFRLDLIKSWRSESSTSCMSVSSFQRTRACGSTCCESGRLCAQAWQRRWEDSGNFSTALFRQPVFTRMVDIAPDVGFRQSWYRRKAGATYFPKVQALHRGELGFARYDPANGGRWNVPYAKGFDHNFLVSRPFWARKVSNRSSHYVLQNGPGAVSSIQFSVWSTGQVKPWSNLVNLGRTLVKTLQTPGNVSRTAFRGFLGQRWTPVGLWERLGQTLVKLRSTLASLDHTWLGPGRPAMRADTRENPVEGFKPKSPDTWNPDEWSKGCVRTTQLSCHDKDKIGFDKFVGLKLPDTTYSWVNGSMNLEECRVKCLNDCNCTAYSNSDIRNGGSGCVIWYGDLIDIRQISANGHDANGQDVYIRMPTSDQGMCYKICHIRFTN